MQLSEQEYWTLVCQGDKPAYERIFRTYYQSLCNYAGSLLKNFDEAEEAVQNIFFNIWNRREHLNSETAPKAYLYRAVHNECLNRIRHDKVKAVYAGEFRNSIHNSPADSLQLLNARELNQKINKALESLPKQCGEVFRLNRLEDLRYAEIADKLGISVKTVEAHMGKALKILREQLKEYLPMLALILSLIFHA